VFPKPLADQYQALTQAWGLMDVSNRTRIELTGEDRASFLNGFCTNDIRRLEPGHGCEAFLTNVKGKTIGHVFVFCGPQSLIIETVPDQADAILAHLDRYLIREDVRMNDRTADWGELLVAGPQAGVSLSRWLEADLDQRIREQAWLSLYRIKSGGEDAYLALMPCADLSRRIDQLTSQGAELCSDAALDILRIEAGWPQFGKDITDANLPQEVNRDALAISFTKGCYLGQETVARLDALGHVNRLLVSVRWLGSTIPAAGEQLEADGQPVGMVTSAVWSPRWSAPLALAYVRTTYHHEGTPLQSAAGPAVVVKSGTSTNGAP
jgi:tRNA-modifying protein YgfZ